MRKLEDPIKYSKGLEKLREKCKCGHTLIMPVQVEKKICSFCGRIVINNTFERFKYKYKNNKNS